jgi:hypothetical protein
MKKRDDGQTKPTAFCHNLKPENLGWNGLKQTRARAGLFTALTLLFGRKNG